MKFEIYLKTQIQGNLVYGTLEHDLNYVNTRIAPSPGCIWLCQWPSTWKMGEWTPVFKSGDRKQDSNYRPITYLITVDKIFEQLQCKQITNQYDHTLYPRMTAYRKSYSCQTALLMLVEDQKMAIDRKVSLVSMDMSKKKLNAYFFDANSFHLIRSFLQVDVIQLNLTTWQVSGKMCSAVVLRDHHLDPSYGTFSKMIWRSMWQSRT